MQNKSLRHNDYGSQALALICSGRGCRIITGHGNLRVKTQLTTHCKNKNLLQTITNSVDLCSDL